ncbi:MAG: glycine cleavage system aminomethyltransferase GcvT [Bacteroidetes bacterium]|nr:glycine cleavage system aminomethyltransferase GcvT [Bacteroidota bacterium]
MKHTPFYNIHCSLGAKMISFAGYEMPLQYRGIIEEHNAVRTTAGIFDTSHMGEIVVSGKDAQSFLQEVTVNDVSKLSIGKVQYTVMCNDHGGIVDDLLIYRLDECEYLLVVNAINRDKDYKWLLEHRRGVVTISDRSDEFAMIAVQGPQSLAIVQKLTNIDIMNLYNYHCTYGEVAGESMIISRTGYTGEIGVELYFQADETLCAKVWKALVDAGREFGIVPAGLGARDTLRLEMGYRLYGQDIDETTSPLEAGLDWITKLAKPMMFIGKNELLRKQQQGIKRRLIGFVVSDSKRIARHGYSITDGVSFVGVVTSGGYSPSLQKSIGLGYVTVDVLQRDLPLAIDIRGTHVPMSLTNIPFYKK